LGQYALGGRSHLFGGLAADYDLVRTRYILHTAPTGPDVSVFEPWRFRPTALIGVSSDVLAR
jgi:hypothetical protein